MFLCDGSIEVAVVGVGTEGLGGQSCLSGSGFSNSSFLCNVFPRSLHVNGSSHASQ